MQETDLLLSAEPHGFDYGESSGQSDTSRLSWLSDEDEDDYIQRKHQELIGNMPWYTRPSVLTLAICSFLHSFSTVMAEGSRQIVIFKQSCNSVADSRGICDPIATQELVSKYNFYSLLVLSIATTSVVGRMGRLADIHGRKPVIALILLAAAIGKLIQLHFFSHSPVGLPFFGLLFGNFVDSCCGGFFAFTSMASAYVSDVVPVNKRTLSLSLAMGAASMGRAVGPILSDAVLDYYGEKPSPNAAAKFAAMSQKSSFTHVELAPIKVEFFISVVVLLYAVFVLPESRGFKARQKSRASSIVSSNTDLPPDPTEQPSRQYSFGNSFSAQVREIFRPLYMLTYPKSMMAQVHKNNNLRARACVLILVTNYTICAAWMLGVAAILIQYGVYRFDWNAHDIGHLLSLLSLAQFVVFIAVSPFLNNFLLQRVLGLTPMKRQMDMIDYIVLLVGYAFEFLAFFSIAQSNNATEMLIAFVMVSMASLVQPAITSTLSKFYPTARRAELFTALTMLISVMNIVVPYVVVTLYNWSLRHNWPSMVIYIHMGLVTTAIVAVFVAKKLLRLTRSSTEEELLTSNASIALRG